MGFAIFEISLSLFAKNVVRCWLLAVLIGIVFFVSSDITLQPSYAISEIGKIQPQTSHLIDTLISLGAPFQ
jgi:hypothetical protein